MCFEKILYDTQELALQAIKGICRKTHTSMKTYKCPFGPGYHVTSVKKAKLKPQKKLKYRQEDEENPIINVKRFKKKKRKII